MPNRVTDPAFVTGAGVSLPAPTRRTRIQNQPINHILGA